MELISLFENKTNDWFSAHSYLAVCLCAGVMVHW